MAEPRPLESKFDPAKSNFVALVGRKGSGKSEIAERLFLSYPYDRLVVDPHKDTLPSGEHALPRELKVQELTTPLPPRLLSLDEGPTTWRFLPDAGSETYYDDLDRAAGLAFNHSRKGAPMCAWLDEMEDVTRVNRTGPFMRRALREGRHRRLTLLMPGIRPMGIDPLVVGQADWVFMFDTPQPQDRRRVAEGIGWDPKELDGLVHGLPKFGYLRYERAAHELVEFPPLPVARRRASPAAR
ncbi:MAG: hypothetical protein JWP02_1497 [Acidimicrobiales bacterium]|nr:hypothetical protein [Acidimicrobiales bacterium]